MVLVSPPCFWIGTYTDLLPVDAHDVVLQRGAVHGVANIGNENRFLALRSLRGMSFSASALGTCALV